jgi:UDP-N-acetylglucosamine transferase subunit ALG13
MMHELRLKLPLIICNNSSEYTRIADLNDHQLAEE